MNVEDIVVGTGCVVTIEHTPPGAVMPEETRSLFLPLVELEGDWVGLSPVGVLDSLYDPVQVPVAGQTDARVSAEVVMIPKGVGAFVVASAENVAGVYTFDDDGVGLWPDPEGSQPVIPEELRQNPVDVEPFVSADGEPVPPVSSPSPKKGAGRGAGALGALAEAPAIPGAGRGRGCPFFQEAEVTRSEGYFRHAGQADCRHDVRSKGVVEPCGPTGGEQSLNPTSSSRFAQQRNRHWYIQRAFGPCVRSGVCPDSTVTGDVARLSPSEECSPSGVHCINRGGKARCRRLPPRLFRWLRDVRTRRSSGGEPPGQDGQIHHTAVLDDHGIIEEAERSARRIDDGLRQWGDGRSEASWSSRSCNSGSDSSMGGEESDQDIHAGEGQHGGGAARHSGPGRSACEVSSHVCQERGAVRPEQNPDVLRLCSGFGGGLHGARQVVRGRMPVAPTPSGDRAVCAGSREVDIGLAVDAPARASLAVCAMGPSGGGAETLRQAVSSDVVCGCGPVQSGCCNCHRGQEEAAKETSQTCCQEGLKTRGGTLDVVGRSSIGILPDMHEQSPQLQEKHTSLPSLSENQAAKCRVATGALLQPRSSVRAQILSWCFALPRVLLSVPCAVGQYLRSCMFPSVSFIGSPADATDVWPCPPPYSVEPGPPPLAGHSRSRWRLRMASQSWSNMIIVVLSHLALKGVRTCPSAGVAGRALNDRQWLAVAQVRRLTDSMCRTPHSEGRCAQKFHQLFEHLREVFGLEIGAVVKAPPKQTVMPFRPVRCPFSKREAHVSLWPWLPIGSCACFVEPAVLEAPPELRVEHTGRWAASKEEKQAMREYIEQWDKVGKLALFPARLVPKGRRSRLFATAKSDVEDRVVTDRIYQNDQELDLIGEEQNLPGGPDLVEMHVPKGHTLKIWAEDLEDMYPAVDGTFERAVSNALDCEFTFEELKGLSAVKKALKRFPDMASGKILAGCLGLPMGDKAAVNWATSSHCNVLQHAGSLQPDQRICNKKPFPRSGSVELLAIDDHLGIAHGSSASPEWWDQCHSSFERGRRAVEEAGWYTSAKKRRAGESNAVGVGAEILGDENYIGSERERRFYTSKASLQIACKRRATGDSLRRVFPLWTSELLYRRPLLSLIDQGFKQLPELSEPQDRVLSISAKVANELTVLSILSPAMTTDVAAEYTDRLIATDASLKMSGATVASITPTLHAEMWRHRERKGHYTVLRNKESQHIMSCGTPYEREALEEDLEAEFERLENEAVHSSSPSPPSVFVEVFDFLELCCGQDSPLLNSVAKRGFRVGPKIDLRICLFWDISNCRIVEWVLFLVINKRVWWVHSGFPCTTFSIARHPKLRAWWCPWGFDPHEQHTALGNAMATVCLLILHTIKRVGNCHGSHEHPKTAFSWKLKFWEWFLSSNNKDVPTDARFACPSAQQPPSLPTSGKEEFADCAFGAVWRKEPFWARYRAFFIARAARKCPKNHQHVRLEGHLTTLSAKYPAAKCDSISAEAWRDHCLENWIPNLPQDSQSSVGHEMLWFNEIMSSLKWDLYSSGKLDSAHINV